MTPGLLGTWLRLFTLQASWSHQRMQGVGVGFSSEPLLRRLADGDRGAAYRAAVARSTRFFNSHPYLAGLAVGALARAETDGADPARLERLRTTLKGPLGLVGDRLVWAGVLPVLSALALVVAATGRPMAALVGFLVAFNVVHLTIRAWALSAGWRLGPSVGQALKHPVLQGTLRVIGPCALVAVGFAVPVVGQSLTDGLATAERGWVVGLGAVGAVTLRWLMATLGGARLGLLGVAMALVAGWVWV